MRYSVRRHTQRHTRIKKCARDVAYDRSSAAKRDCLICRITLQGGWEVALYLANTLRDDLNAGIARITHGARGKMFCRGRIGAFPLSRG